MKTLPLALLLAFEACGAPAFAQRVELVFLPWDASPVQHGGGRTGVAPQPWALDDSDVNYIQTDNTWSGGIFDSVPAGTGEMDTLFVTLRAEDSVRFQLVAMDATRTEGKMIVDTAGPMEWGERTYPLAGVARQAVYIMLWVPDIDYGISPPRVNAQDRPVYYGRMYVVKQIPAGVDQFRESTKMVKYTTWSDVLGRIVDSSSVMTGVYFTNDGRKIIR